MSNRTHPTWPDDPSHPYPSAAEVEALIEHAHALRAAAMARALATLAGFLWQAWTAGIRDVPPAARPGAAQLAPGGAD